MSLKIGLHIKKTLTEYAPLNNKISGRIFPVLYPLSERQPTYPYLSYASNGLSNEETKDYADEGQDEVNVEIRVCAKRYDDMIEVAQLVRDAFTDSEAAHYENDGIEDDEWEYDDFSVIDYGLSSGAEDYDLVEDCYNLPINITFVTEPK